MVVANTMHASSPASSDYNQVTGRNRQGQSPRAGKGGCHVDGDQPVIQRRAGNDTQDLRRTRG